MNGTVYEDPVWTYLLAATMCLFSILSVGGNLLILTALITDKSLHSRSNKFIRNLAFADMCVGIWTMPVTFASMINGSWIFDWLGPTSELYVITCNFSGFLDNTLLTARMWTLAISSIDRFLLIRYPAQYRDIITELRLKLMILCVWLLAVFAAFPPLVGWDGYGYSDRSFNCGIKGTAGWEFDRYFFLYYFIIVFPLPVIIIIYCYFVIFSVTLETNNTMQSHNKNKDNQHIEKTDLGSGCGNEPRISFVTACSTPNHKSQRRAWMMFRVTVSIFIIVTASIISVMPILIIGMIGWSGVMINIGLKADQIVHWIFVGNSAANPIIFGLMNPIIRASIIGMFQRRFKHYSRSSKRG